MVRGLGAAFVAVSLAACAAGGEIPADVTSATSQVSAGNWKIDRRSDRVSGAPLATASLSLSKINFVTGKIDEGELQLLCFKSQPVIRVAFNFKVGSNRSASIAYRFDQNKARDAAARFLPDFRTIVIDEPAEVARFVEDIRTAEMLFVRIDSLIVGRTNIQLRVHGAPAAVEAAFADCPLAAQRRA
jgi:hypothetical protein